MTGSNACEDINECEANQPELLYTNEHPRNEVCLYILCVRYFDFESGGYINKSLLTLSHIILKLSDAAKDRKDISHLPYRDSKLTRILKPALDGDSRMSIICWTFLIKLA